MNNLITKLYVKALNNAGGFLKKEDGVTAIEYAIVVAGVAAVVLVVFQQDGAFGTALTDVFTELKTKLTNTIKA